MDTNRARYWEMQEWNIDVLTTLFVSPEWLRDQGWFAKNMMQLARNWLRLIEACVRRALFIDALALLRAGAAAFARTVRTRTKPARRPPARAGGEDEPEGAPARRAPFPLLPPAPSVTSPHGVRRPRLRRPRWLGPEARDIRPVFPRFEPTGALVRLHAIPRRARAERRAGYVDRGWIHPRATAPLARRFETLIRVVAEPEPYVRRLARLLAGPDGRTHGERLLVPPTRSRADPYGQFIATMQEEAEAASRAFAWDSS
jgi:hypothetical protein